MSFNFCDPSLKPTFSCVQPSHEGYEVTNLASHNHSDRMKGFLAYGFPPVSVSVRFLCSVNIGNIVIWPQVRSQKSLGLEILVRSAVKQKQWWQSGNSSSGKIPATTFVGQDDSFHRVGSVLLSSSDEGVIFSKHGLKSPNSLQPKFIQKSLFRHYALENADSIQIKIFKTASSAPALGKVQVWGNPGTFSCELSSSVPELWSNRHQVTAVIPPNRPTHMSAGGSIDQTFEATIAAECLIPEEFLDSLTCNIMSLPYILPSGKTVDKVTLEKHGAFETMYGRALSDPFTGIPFTESYQPVPDNNLKRRIDSFLVANSHRQELKNIPRTTGTIKRHCASTSVHTSTQFNRLVGLSFGADSVQGSSNSTDTRIVQFPVPMSQTMKRQAETIVHDKDLVKRIKEEDVRLPAFRSNCSTNSAVKRPSTLCGTNLNFSTPLIRKEQCAKTHDEKLEESLQSAIKSALLGKPNYVDFTAKSSPTAAQPRAPSCVICNNSAILYALPCNHLLCRDCLVSKKQVQPTVCPDCHSTYESCNVIRFHGGPM